MVQKKIFYKLSFFIVIVLSFLSSYLVKNFQLLLVSICLLTLFGFFFNKLNKNILLVFFSLLISITIVEFTLFLKNEKKIVIIKNDKNINKHVKNKKTYLGYQPVTGKQHHKIYLDNTSVIDSYYTINKNNYRFTPSINDLNKKKKFNFFGGSQTFGWGLSDDETLPYLTQFYFKEWDVNNYAISGYGVHHMLAQIKEEPRVIGDMNILVTFSAHIPRSSCKRDFTFGTPKYVLNDKREILRAGYCNFGFMNKLPLPSIVGSVLNRSEIKILLDKIYFRKSLFSEKDIELYLAIIKEINQTLFNQGKIFYVGYTSNENEVDKYILNKFKQNKIKTIDLSLDESNQKYKILNDGHPTKLANTERSLAIWKNIKKNLNN